MYRLAMLLVCVLLVGCEVPTNTGVSFASVVQRVEPVAEAECRRRAPRVNCDFKISIDETQGQPPNAFQSEDKRGRPLIVFTRALLEDARNEDELAFILGHEAAHHIAGHLAKSRRSARQGAILLGGLAEAAGQSEEEVRQAAEVGAAVGSLRYSKEFEFEADALGARIAQKAGYDALRGARFFNRIPDPGDRFLGTHPPNRERLDRVEAEVAKL